MTDPVHPSPEDSRRALAEEIQAIGLSARKNLLRSMMPTLDIAQRQGVGYEDLTKALEKAGIPLKSESLRKALFRWRKRYPARTTEAPPNPDSSAAAPQPAPAPSPAVAPNIVRNKADLVRLRTSKQPIDLNALAELGRQK